MTFDQVVSRLPNHIREDVRHALPTLCAMVRGSEDLFQSCLMAIWQSLPKFRGESARATYFIAVARSVVQQHWRREGIRRKFQLEEATATSPSPVGLTLLPGTRVCSCGAPYAAPGPRHGKPSKCPTCTKVYHKAYYQTRRATA